MARNFSKLIDFKVQHPSKKETGIHGEHLAEEYLTTLGHKILDRNWRYSKSEIDIISMDGVVLVFTEVKTRSYDFFGKPESFVSNHKELLMHEAASIYMEKINHHWEFRFDIIGILIDQKGQHHLEHFKDAF